MYIGIVLFLERYLLIVLFLAVRRCDSASSTKSDASKNLTPKVVLKTDDITDVSKLNHHPGGDPSKTNNFRWKTSL